MMNQGHVLFVDDDVLNQWLLTDSLSTLGFAVTGLCRGAEAVAVLEDGQEFDLLLTDLHMPDGMTGFELADHWRRAQPGRPVIYTSNDPQFAIGALERDEGFIRKHADLHELLVVITEVLTVTFGGGGLAACRRRTHYVH